MLPYLGLSFPIQRAWASPAVPAWGGCPLFLLPRECEDNAPSISPSQGVDLGTVLFYHPFWGGPSILAACALYLIFVKNG